MQTQSAWRRNALHRVGSGLAHFDTYATRPLLDGCTLEMSKRDADRPILVTGAPRSGTTWVGRMLAHAPGVGYIHEPFNPTTDAGISGGPFAHFFEYVTTENEAVYARHLERTLRFSYDLRRQVPTVRSARDAARTGRDLAEFAWSRARRRRALMKDPIAVFSTAWLAERFEMDVVVTIRHPGAFVASFKRLGWHHDFSSFLRTPQLMQDHLGPFEADIRRIAAHPGDSIEESILLWRLVYSTVRRYRDEHPDWTFVRHEDLSFDTAQGYADLYAALGLEYTPAARAAVLEHSAESNPSVTQTHAVRRDSRSSATGWRRRLGPHEIERVREGVHDVSPAFYGDDEW